MKKLLIILFFITSAHLLRAQVVFGAPGAKWRYAFAGVDGPQAGTIYYRSDTLIANETIKVFRFSNFFPVSAGDPTHSVLIRQKGDTIFMKTLNTRNTWQILYNFAATAGQSWTTSVIDSSFASDHVMRTTTVNVVSTGTVSVNNTSLKQLHVTYCYVDNAINTLQCDTATILERIGCTKYLFNYFNHTLASDPYELTYFLCYSDFVVGSVSYSPNGCNYYVGIKENSLPAEIKIYPTPATSVLTVDLTDAPASKNYTMKLINSLGQVALSPQLTGVSTTFEINLSGLNSGIYFLQLLDGGKLSGVQKIVKE